MKFKKSLLAIVFAGLSCILPKPSVSQEPSILFADTKKPIESIVQTQGFAQYQESIGTPRDVLDLDGFGRAVKTSKGYSWGNSSTGYPRYVIGGDTLFIDRNRLDITTSDPKTKITVETQILDLNGDGIVDEVQIRRPVKDNPGRVHVTRIVNVQGPESVVYPPYVESEGSPGRLYYEARRFTETKPDSVALEPFQKIYDLMDKKSD